MNATGDSMTTAVPLGKPFFDLDALVRPWQHNHFALDNHEHALHG